MRIVTSWYLQSLTMHVSRACLLTQYCEVAQTFIFSKNLSPGDARHALEDLERSKEKNVFLTFIAVWRIFYAFNSEIDRD